MQDVINSKPVWGSKLTRCALSPLPYAGEWVESLKSYAGGIALHPDSSIYDIGIDWIAPYNSTQHSIGILFICCADMDPHNKGKIWNQGVIAIIPGPRMPSVLHPYLQPIVDDLLRLASDGMRVSPAAAPANPEAAEGAAAGGAGGTAVGGMADGQAPADGDLRGTRPFQHRVFLGQVLADTPARAKVACGNGQNSRVSSCMWCLFEAHMEANVGHGATVRFRGYMYTQAVSQHFVKWNAGKSLKVGARALKKTHRHFVSTGGVMQAMYRMLHLGAPHKITQKQFDEVALQTGCKGLTAFAALPYANLSCLFTVSTGHALLFGMPADPDAELVMSREACQRITARGQFLVMTSDFGRRYKCIMQYRKSYRMEDWLHFIETSSSYTFKGDMLLEACGGACAARSHTTSGHGPPTRPECQLGSTAGFSDLPVEHMMQQMKTQGGRMVSQAPEKHYVQWLCLIWASESLTEADPATGAKHTTNQQLERMLARRAAHSFLHAEALDEEQYFRAEYGRQQQRTSCWACYQAEVGNKTRTYAAYLKYFVHLPAEDGAQDVRFTVADVYSGQVFSGGLVVVNMAAAQKVRAGSQWEMWQDLGLPLTTRRTYARLEPKGHPWLADKRKGTSGPNPGARSGNKWIGEPWGKTLAAKHGDKAMSLRGTFEPNTASDPGAIVALRIEEFWAPRMAVNFGGAVQRTYGDRFGRRAGTVGSSE
ncbi:hypothetical protein VOLCADRAFT_100848 [Volvox carteri f. nagariensis]|uniref:Uncharacterized protein n=1 Tax=Volvox carteri f. nagariensis TaxID=3068 RepID=D8UL64_VOLCA|nr:uncharacterized protein VOLCADRAFT_100848 [Volvox carteri f. nagariensis]EFJ39535.1 hypothetical protein VOLCADRAFT_100848 [Volvox carteri f. nagariensis]|eukprot:XP_002959400.1 hypothetical protein VOLCADRAFT_100848 [Volvox carteri f. nagariensis]